MPEKEENSLHSEKRFEREGMLPESTEPRDSRGMLPIRVQTINVDALSLSPGVSASPVLCVDFGPLLGITAVKCFKWRACCPSSGCSDGGDSYVTDRGRRLAHHPEKAIWSSEENGVWLRHPQRKKWTVIVLCFSICDFAMWIWLQRSELSRFPPCEQWKTLMLYLQRISGKPVAHTYQQLLAWMVFI